MPSDPSGAMPAAEFPSENTHRNTVAVLPTADRRDPKASQEVIDQLVTSITKRIGNGGGNGGGRTLLGFSMKALVVALLAAGGWAFAFYQKTEDKPTVEQVNTIVETHSKEPHPPTLKRIEKNEAVQRVNSDTLIKLTTIQSQQAATMTEIKNDIRVIRRQR